MDKIKYMIIMVIIFVSTLLFSSFVFIPTVAPYEIVNVDISPITYNDMEEEEVEDIPTLMELWVMEEGMTKIMEAEVLNRELPPNWLDKGLYFKYTYIGQYNEYTQEVLDDLLLDEYKWQKQLDEQGNVVMGGIVLSKDGTYQLHTHNTFTQGNRFYLLGDLLDRYHNEEGVVGTRIRFGGVILESVWERDIRILEGGSVPYADLIISTCLERWGDRRLISGWNIVWENI
jgi:hypothetical protein